MRARLRKLNLDNSRILDIHFPDQQVVALLTHNDFVGELLDTFNRFGVQPLNNFDPTDPSRLRDPKYANLTHEDRQQQAIAPHHDRLLRALDHMRAPVKFAVARHFLNQSLIALDELKEILSGAKGLHPRSDTTTCEDAANIFTLGSQDEDAVTDEQNPNPPGTPPPTTTDQ